MAPDEPANDALDNTPDNPAAEEAVDGQVVPEAIAHALREQIQGISVQATVQSGPLPSPQMLAEYDEVLPGLARTMIEQWQAETRNRHETRVYNRETDRIAMESYYEGERRGMTFALVLGIGVLLVVALALVLDSPLVGLAGLVAAIGTMIWAIRRRSHAVADPYLDAAESTPEDDESPDDT